MATGSFSCALATSQSGWVQQMPDGLRGRSLEERLAISTSCRAWGTDSLASLGKFRLDFRLRSRRRGADFMRVLPSRPKARGIAVLSRPDDEFREGAEIDGNGAAGGETSPFEDQVPGQDVQIDLQLPRRRLLVEFTCNVCQARTQRLINPEAYKRGTVYVQETFFFKEIGRRVASLFTAQSLVDYVPWCRGDYLGDPSL
ncbi:unnamed protein product [Calypogeia fissa]